MKALELKKSLLSTPGDTIQEHIDHIGMSQAELAERIGRSEAKLNELIKGKASITTETAAKLELVLGIPASFWLNRERIYQEELLEIDRMEFFENCKSWVSGFPLTILKNLKILPDTNKKADLAEALLKFFRVASPEEWTKVYERQSVAFKIDLKHTQHPKAIATWLRLGEIQAEAIQVEPFDKKKLTNALPEMQELAYKNPGNWMKKLQSICASFGVALVYTPKIQQAPIYGAARWIKNKTIPLIQLTDRQKDYNAFWFSFYHELAHIRYHKKSDIFLEGIDNISPDTVKEKEADDFAVKLLIGENLLDQLKTEKPLTIEKLKGVSKSKKVHVSILVSQLQRLKIIEYSDQTFNKLKVKIEFTDFQ